MDESFRNPSTDAFLTHVHESKLLKKTAEQEQVPECLRLTDWWAIEHA